MKIFLIVVVAIGVVVAVLFFKNKEAVAPENGSTTETPVFCTQDAKQCPDGSYVSRQSPKCEFAACPPSVSNPSVSKSASPMTTVKAQIMTITFANGTATPNIITIKAGDTVKFINNDSSPRWPASGSHPTHQICPGFDALHGLNNGDSYSFTFNTAKTCPWHDHLKPAINGKIEVTP